jgi:hypothetical protein
MQTKFALIAGLGLVLVMTLSAFSSVGLTARTGSAFSLAPVVAAPDIRLGHLFDLAQSRAALAALDLRTAHIFDIAQASAAAAGSNKDISLPHTLYFARALSVLAASNNLSARIFDIAQASAARSSVDNRKAHIFDLENY